MFIWIGRVSPRFKSTDICKRWMQMKLYAHTNTIFADIHIELSLLILTSNHGEPRGFATRPFYVYTKISKLETNAANLAYTRLKVKIVFSVNKKQIKN